MSIGDLRGLHGKKEPTSTCWSSQRVQDCPVEDGHQALSPSEGRGKRGSGRGYLHASGLLREPAGSSQRQRSGAGSRGLLHQRELDLPREKG